MADFPDPCIAPEHYFHHQNMATQWGGGPSHFSEGVGRGCRQKYSGQGGGGTPPDPGRRGIPYPSRTITPPPSSSGRGVGYPPAFAGGSMRNRGFGTGTGGGWSPRFCRTGGEGAGLRKSKTGWRGVSQIPEGWGYPLPFIRNCRIAGRSFSGILSYPIDLFLELPAPAGNFFWNLQQLSGTFFKIAGPRCDLFLKFSATDPIFFCNAPHHDRTFFVKNCTTRHAPAGGSAD